MAEGAELRVQGLSKRFAAVAALRAVDLALPGGYVCVMGASGSGKTTLLRIIAGLERADAGTVTLAGERLDGLPPERRPTRTVFQTPALFPQLSVLDNVSFGARLRPAKGNQVQTRARAGELLDRLGLDPARFGDREPGALSGGEQQRVALARALFQVPRWLLLDEPLSALDRPRRGELRRVLATLSREQGCSVLHVTHEAEEAMALAELLVIMSEGRVVAQGPPAQLYARPPDLVTARLLGELSLVPGSDLARGQWLRPERLRVVARDDPQARAPALLRAQLCAGPRWELELGLEGEGDRAPVLVFASEPWSGEGRCALSWADEDLIDSPPRRR